MGSVPIKISNVGVVVWDPEATIGFSTDLGLTVVGRATVSGERTDTAVCLDGNHANVAMRRTPDGNVRLDLSEHPYPDAIGTEPTRPDEIGVHRVALSVDDIDEAFELAAGHGCHPSGAQNQRRPVWCTVPADRWVRAIPMAFRTSSMHRCGPCIDRQAVDRFAALLGTVDWRA